MKYIFIKIKKYLLKKITNFFSSVPNNYQKFSFSQTGEDLIIDFIFSSKNIYAPSYIDIGAFDPYHFSNTAIFYKKNSKGINIEPNPEGFQKFRELRPLDINLNIGVSNKEEYLQYYFINASTMNTFDINVVNELVKKYGFKVIEKREIPCLTLQSVISQYSNNIFPDLLSLDVEGLDMEIIKQIDFDKCYPKVICVETVGYSHDGNNEKDLTLINFLTKKGYFVFADTFINTIFVRNSFWKNQ